MDARLHHHPQAQQLPPSRAAACGRHPDEQVTGFCAACLRERLAGLDPATRRLKPAPSSSGAPAAALRSLFSRLPGGHLSNHHNAAAAAPSSWGSGVLPELRRCKSFSGGRGAPPASGFEPQRRSCDVRGRSTLWSLFHLDDGGATGGNGNPSRLFAPPIYYAAAAGAAEVEAMIEPQRSLGLAGPVLESGGEEEEEEEEHYSDAAEAGEPEKEQLGGGDEELREVKGHEELRPMKDHIDLDAQSKKAPVKDIAGGFWLAASVFSEKLRKWRRKHKTKKPGTAAGETAAGASAAAAVIRAGTLSSRSRRLFRETQSEVAEDAFGRRSCDTEPRFSLDAGRVSFDDPRYSWDEPRASWDGHLVGGGGRPAFPRLPPMISVMEEAPIVAAVPLVQRSDGQIPVEEDAAIPGGSAQTREYYSDSLSQRRRRSLDRSGSVGRPSFDAADQPLPAKAASIARVSPTAMANEYFFHHVGRLQRDNGDSRSNSLRDDCSESLESAYRDSLKGGGGDTKKSRRWSKAWSLWGLIHRRGHGGGTVGVNVVERSLSESWPDLRRAHSGKFVRSNSSVSSRNSFGCSNDTGRLSSMRNGLEINGRNGKKRREEFVLERNRSSRYSPSHVDNGMLRFYLTPMASSRRSKALGKGWYKNAHPLTRSMMRLY